MTRVWMSLQTKEKNHYVIRLTAGMAGIILLAFLLIFLCARIIIELDEYKEIISLLMCAGMTGIIIFFAVWLGRVLQRDAMIFYEDPAGRLYVSDVRQYIGYRRGIIGAMQMALRTQKELAGLKKQAERQGFSSAGMTEILKVDVMKEHPRFVFSGLPGKNTGKNGQAGELIFLGKDMIMRASCCMCWNGKRNGKIPLRLRKAGNRSAYF